MQSSSESGDVRLFVTANFNFVTCRLAHSLCWMNATVFKTAHKDTYLLLPLGKPFSSLSQDVLDQLGSLQLFGDVSIGPNLIGLNPVEIENDLRTQGYSIRSFQLNVWERN